MVSLSAVFNSDIPLDRANVSLEVHDASGGRVFQQVFPAQTLNQGQDAAYAARWAVPRDLLPGRYSLQIGAFSTDWSVSYGWNEAAGAITVADSFAGIAPTTYYVDGLLGIDSNSG